MDTIWLNIDTYISLNIYNCENRIRKCIYCRRKQTSDNIDRWKAEMGRVREEKRRRKKFKKRKSPKKEDPGARKGRKVAKHRVFPMICGSGGRKVGSLKRRVQSQLARWEVKNCTPLWRKTHVQVKKLKTPHVRSTFRSWDVEKEHAVVARSTFPSKWKCTKHLTFGELFKGCDVEKVHAVVARSTFPSQNDCQNKCTKMYKTPHVRTTFGSWDVDKLAENKGPPYPYIILDHSPANRICTNRDLIWFT